MGSVSTHTLTNQRLGRAATHKRGLIPVQHIYVTNIFIRLSLPNELYRIGFELSKLHASIYLALLADAYAGLQCCFTVHVCHLSLSAGQACDKGPGSDMETSNVQIEHMVV